jgi:uncharacterized protein (TIGR02597 family)
MCSKYLGSLLLSFLLFFVASAQAQVNSAAQGFFMLGAYDTNGNYLGLLANSDTLISIPFVRPVDFSGSIQSVSGNIITLSGSPGWAPNQFVYASDIQTKTYYALIGAGSPGTVNPKEGCIYPVTANGTNTVTVDLNGDSISSILPNSQISLIPYWTLATIFPPSKANLSFTPTTSTRTYKTQILIPNSSAVGTNLGYSETYYFINSGSNVGWRLFGDAITTDHSDDILVPTSFFVVRNSNGAATLPLAVSGTVQIGKVTSSEGTLPTQSQDNALAMIRPISVSLNNLGLNPEDSSFISTTSTRSFQDELFLYNNNQSTQNKSPSVTYYYMNNAWRLFGDSSTVDHGADLILAGTAITIRKAPSGTGYTDFWQNPPNY